MLPNSCWLKVESPVLYCFVSIYSHSNSIWNKCTAWPKQQQCHVGSPCLSFCNHSIWQDWTQAGESNGFDWDIWRRKFAQQFFFSPGLLPLMCLLNYNCHLFPQGLVNVALDILSRIHTIPTVPIVDCFQKIRQQVKCYLQLAGVMGKNECMQVRFFIFFGLCHKYYTFLQYYSVETQTSKYM